MSNEHDPIAKEIALAARKKWIRIAAGHRVHAQEKEHEAKTTGLEQLIKKQRAEIKKQRAEIRRLKRTAAKEISEARRQSFIDGSASTMQAVYAAIDDFEFTMWLSQRLLGNKTCKLPRHLEELAREEAA